VIVRTNQGLDFGSWAAAFAKYENDLEGDLLLANDSVYGPTGDLSAAITVMKQYPADFYGFVESLQGAPHLQSWFVLLQPQAYRSAAFRAALTQPFQNMDKAEIIKAGELGLTATLREAGLRSHALYGTPNVGPLGKQFPANPTHSLWRVLIESGRLPFVKVELLRDNPAGVPDICDWPSVVGARAPTLVPIIEADLARRMRLNRPTRLVSTRLRFAQAVFHGFLVRDHELSARRRTRLARIHAELFLRLLALKRAVVGRRGTP
jgi:hypothetical protein